MRILLLLLVCWNAWGADKYFDLSCTFDGNGASGTCAASGGAAGARNTLSVVAADNDTWLFKRGNTYTRASQIDLGAAASVTWDDYGDTALAKPIIRMAVTNFGAINVATATGVATFNDLTIDSCTTTNAGDTAGCIVASKIGGTGRAASLAINRVDFSNTTKNAITINGTDTATAASTFTVQDSSFADIGADAVYGGALVYTWDDTDCTRVSTNSIVGDCIGYINADPTTISITDSRLDHSNNDYKQVIMIDSTSGAGTAIVENNEIIGYGSISAAATTQTALLTDIATVVKRNYFECAGFCVGFGAVAGNKLESNILRIKNIDDTSPSVALYGDNGTVTNNVFIGDSGSSLGTRGTTVMAATHTGWNYRNNAFKNLPTAIKSDSVGNNPTTSYNSYYDVTSQRLDSAGAPFASGGNDVTTDPLFRSGNYPTTPAGFRLTCSSPLRVTGTDVGRLQDYGNRAFAIGKPSIGAWEHASGDDRCTLTARTTITPRTTITARSTVTPR